jgi:peptidyl-prolyl cis-trans isomerase A (cyclophilin A)
MTAPAEYRVKFSTSKGDFIVKVTRDAAPKGADRFYTMVKSGFLDECRFFRVVSDFMVQFGVNGDPRVSAVWENSEITDDPVKLSNVRGALTFAMKGPDSRTTQLFINLKNNKRLDDKFAPFGTVTEGMEVVDGLHAGYGDAPPNGSGPNQNLIKAKGNDYLNQDFKKLDFIKTARVID